MTAQAHDPPAVRVALMRQTWESLTFVHWRYPVDVVQRLVPRGLTVEQHDGSAWVGLVPFWMTVSLPHVVAPPWLGRFPETNVRTYVTDPAGRSGVWFFSLDAARLAAVATARAFYRLPYHWSSMQVDRRDDVVHYRARRRSRRGNPSPGSLMAVRVGDPVHDVTPLERTLTARWRVFSQHRRGLHYVEAEHPPWDLRRATLVELHDDLVTAAGLPAPYGDPLVHFSDGVAVRLGRPRPV